MNGHSQKLFFQKVRNMFARVTVGIPVANKKKYRLSPEELVKVRNLCCFVSQIWPFLSSRIPEIEATDKAKAFVEGTSEDMDFACFLESRPPKFALSMMKSYQEDVKKQEQEKQQVIFSEVAAQREAVVAAQWSFFKTALLSDQATLEKISQVPNYVKAKLHAKAVMRRKQQSDAGEKATRGYQDICSQLSPFNSKNV